MARPVVGQYAEYYQKYIDKIVGPSCDELIKNYSDGFIKLVNSIPEEKADYAYAENKWTVKEVLQHIIDTERVFVYRILRLARKDAYNLPGFDESIFATNSHVSLRRLQSLKDEFTLLRQSTDLLLLSLTEEDLQQKGTANNNPVTANSIMFVIFGHVQHHIEILKERYLAK